VIRSLLSACIAVALAGSAMAQPYGLDTPAVPVGAFLNGVFPPRTPNALSSQQWAIGAAFPSLPQLQDTMAVLQSPNPADNRLYAASREGVIVSFPNVANVSSTTPFLDLQDRVAVVWDGGFLNMQFDPHFGQAGSPYRKYVYVYYSSYCGIDATKNTTDLTNCNPNYRTDGEVSGFFGVYLRLSRFEVPDGATAADKSTEKVLINIRLYNSTHRGGGMTFGDDGMLYLMIGEQYNPDWAQDIVSGLHGGSFRLAVDVLNESGNTWTCPSGTHMPRKIYTGADEVSGRRYCVPDDNPWLDPTGAAFEEYFTLGHRNPFRLTRDPATGRLWEGEVGASTREEINVLVKGHNYGWPFREGLTTGIEPPPPSYIGILTDPVIDFTRDEANCIIGGYVYRGTRYPELVGKYLTADFVTGFVWALTLDTNTMTATKEQLASFDQYSIATWGQDRAGEVYLGSVAGVRPVYTLQRLTNPVPDPPALLSQLGAFTNLATLAPASFWVPYNVNPFWSDGATKWRWIAVPNDGVRNTAAEQIGFSPNSNWTFPTGTVLMKHFELPLDENDPSVTTRLETRFLVHGDDGKWYGVTYRWRPDGSDADLLTDSATQDYTVQLKMGATRTQTWLFPSRAQCLFCHTDAAGGALGPRTQQINRPFTYPSTGRTDNQLRTWNHLGMFSPAISEASIPTLLQSRELGDVTASLEDRSRGFLDSNCSQCHRPDSGNRAFFDARLTTPLTSQLLINGAVLDDLGVPGAKVIKPGDLNGSVLYHRVSALGAIAMPPLAKSRVDDPAVAVLGGWIARVSSNTAQGGLAYEYYKTPPAEVDSLAGFSFQNPTSTGQIANFDLSPATDPDYFVFRYTGYLKVDTAGSYTFYTTSNDGSLLSIDGSLVVNNDGIHEPAVTQSGTVSLTTGYHQIVVSYFQYSYSSSLLVEWQGPGIARQAIPSGSLFVVVPPPPTTNHAPSVTSPGNQTSQVGDLLLVTVGASDPDGDSLYFDASGLPDGLAIDHTTGLISGVVSMDGTGAHAVTIGVSDGPAVASTTFNWNVPVPACSDGIDNDGDGLVDYPADPGCASPTSTMENPACQDGIDNDGDGKIDFDGGASANHGVALGPPDPQCTSATKKTEKPPAGCGLGAELALLVPLIGRRFALLGRRAG
jgi:glucose/arabinose dehydrogenase